MYHTCMIFLSVVKVHAVALICGRQLRSYLLLVVLQNISSHHLFCLWSFYKNNNVQPQHAHYSDVSVALISMSWFLATSISHSTVSQCKPLTCFNSWNCNIPGPPAQFIVRKLGGSCNSLGDTANASQCSTGQYFHSQLKTKFNLQAQSVYRRQ